MHHFQLLDSSIQLIVFENFHHNLQLGLFCNCNSTFIFRYSSFFNTSLTLCQKYNFCPKSRFFEPTQICINQVTLIRVFRSRWSGFRFIDEFLDKVWTFGIVCISPILALPWHKRQLFNENVTKRQKIDFQFQDLRIHPEIAPLPIKPTIHYKWIAKKVSVQV